MQEFDSIRPYRDSETRSALERLIGNPDFVNLIARSKAPTAARLAPAFTRFWVRRWLKREFGPLTTINDVQSALYPYVDDLVRKTTAQVTYSGLEQLERDRCHLFISNHRDIVFDPMVINYLLHRYGSQTTRIAIGDNLLENRLFAEMMRLNKSFVVKRNMSSAREMRDTYQTLSAFIHHSMEENQSIWIAQREGRAKDGIDQTDPAIIKMFFMSHKKSGCGFAKAMKALRIVPVSIAYEYDPCDISKAAELAARAQTGQYQKHVDEDTLSIVQGLSGYKGHVHVHFGKPVLDPPDTASELATRIDREMHEGYHLHASNLAAYNLTSTHPLSHETTGTTPQTVFTAETYSPADMAAATAEMQRRLESIDAPLRPHLLAMYANPVTSALTATDRDEP